MCVRFCWCTTQKLTNQIDSAHIGLKKKGKNLVQNLPTILYTFRFLKLNHRRLLHSKFCFSNLRIKVRSLNFSNFMIISLFFLYIFSINCMTTQSLTQNSKPEAASRVLFLFVRLPPFYGGSRFFRCSFPRHFGPCSW